MINNLLASALAGADADQQAEFFNEFYRLLKVLCKEKHETQLAYIADGLDGNGRELFESMNQFAKLALESRAKVETNIQELYRHRHELEKELESIRSLKDQESEHA